MSCCSFKNLEKNVKQFRQFRQNKGVLLIQGEYRHLWISLIGHFLFNGSFLDRTLKLWILTNKWSSRRKECLSFEVHHFSITVRIRMDRPRFGYVYDERMLEHECHYDSTMAERPQRMALIHERLLHDGHLKDAVKVGVRERSRPKVV